MAVIVDQNARLRCSITFPRFFSSSSSSSPSSLSSPTQRSSTGAYGSGFDWGWLCDAGRNIAWDNSGRCGGVEGDEEEDECEGRLEIHGGLLGL